MDVTPLRACFDGFPSPEEDDDFLADLEGFVDSASWKELFLDSESFNFLVGGACSSPESESEKTPSQSPIELGMEDLALKRG